MVGRRIELAVVNAATSSQRQHFARELAARCNASCASNPWPEHAAYRLIVSDERVELCEQTMKPNRGVIADFSSLDLRPRSGGLSRNQPIAKAMGRGTKTILDATAGMGQDAFLLACLGFEVTMIERSPVIAALLEDGLRRAHADERLRRAMGDRLRLVQGDARHVLEAVAGGTGPHARPDVVYIDPMFPPKRKESALPKKVIQMLRAIVGDDPDAAELYDIARRAAFKRIVVKRPTHAPPLAPKPAASHEGKLARFDVYTPLR